MERNLSERLEIFRSKMVSVHELTSQGTANEMQFYIFDYDPKEEIRIRKEIKKAKDNNASVIEFDLYDMMLDVINEEGYFDDIKDLEQEHDYDVMLSQVFQPLLALEENDSPILRKFRSTVADDGNHIVLISGVGKAYPIIRSHTILNNLQSIFKFNPVVMMYPGRYEVRKKMTLRLFDRLDDDNYYRAFALVERGNEHAN